jgi:DNA-binding transcriptional MerR regulator
MSAIGERQMSLRELSAETGLPQHIIRRFLERHGMVPAPRYPRQHRTFDASRLPELREALTAAGYPTKGIPSCS